MWLADWFLRRRRDDDLEDEIRAHLSMAEQDLRRNGLDAGAAPLAARRTFGNVTLTREMTRQAWGARWRDAVGELGHDIRRVARSRVARCAHQRRHRTPATLMLDSLVVVGRPLRPF